MKPAGRSAAVAIAYAAISLQVINIQDLVALAVSSARTHEGGAGIDPSGFSWRLQGLTKCAASFFRRLASGGDGGTYAYSALAAFRNDG